MQRRPSEGRLDTPRGVVYLFRPPTSFGTSGGVAERPKAAVLKTAARKRRGFESLLLRSLTIEAKQVHPGISPRGRSFWRGGRVVEGARLLSGYTVKSRIAGSNPALSAINV